MRYSVFGYVLGETHKSIWRNRMSSFLSIATIGMALFLLGVAIIVSLNLSFLLTEAQREMEIQAYFYRDTTQSDMAEALSQARQLEGVVDVVFVSKDDAMAELKDRFQDKAGILEGIDNPLPASIRLRTETAEDVPEVVAGLRSLGALEDIVYQEEASRNLALLGRTLQMLSLGGTIVVGLVAVTVIGNATRTTIESRRHEIAIMKLVGATDGFIVGPFVLVGITLGVFGGLIGSGLSVGLYGWLREALSSALPFIPILRLTTDASFSIAGVLVITGIIVGTLGSILSTRKHLDV